VFLSGKWGQPQGIPGLLGMKPLKITARNAGGGVIAYRIDDKDLKDRVLELVDMLAIAGIASAGIQFNQAITMAQTFNVAEVAIQRAVMVPMMERARVEQYRGVVTTNAMIGKF